MRKIIFLKTILLAIVMTAGSGSVWGQTTILSDASTAATPNWMFNNNVTLLPIQQTGYWLIQASGASLDEIITPALDVSTYTNLVLTFQVATYGTGTNNPAKISYSLNGGTSWETTTFTSATPTSSSYISSGSINMGTINSTSLKIKFTNSGTADKGVRMKTVLLVGTPSVPTCTASNLTFATPTYNKAVGDATFTQTATSLNGTTAIVYSTSNSAAAAVDASTGAITIGVAGSATITATQVAGTHSAVDYCAATATYTVNVAAAPCTASNLAFATSTYNKTVGDATFTQTATSLNGTTAIVYSSSNSAAAAVDASTGAITIGVAGSATITATQAARTHNAVDYCTATATYTVNVASTTPTITVMDVTVPAFAANIGNSQGQTINVSAVNLTEGIVLALSGTNADQFSLSDYSVSQTGGSVSGTVVTITYTPTTTGSHTATVTLTSAGASSVLRTLSGSASLNTPVATSSTSPSATGLTANWNAVSGATEYQLDVYTKVSGGTLATDLFISKYVEGSSNNKAIEIFNGTGVSVDLSIYSLKKQTNGAGLYATEQVLSGILLNNDVYVTANTSSNATILGVADSNNNTTMTFNGNDAVALFKSSVQIDEVGVFNQTTDWGKDVTLMRKSSISAPKATYDVADWDSQITDYVTNLGSHTMNGSGNVTTPITGSPFTVTGANSKTLTGLDASTTYYYTVIAKNATVTTAVSNEISASTTATGIYNPTAFLSVSVVNGKIQLSALADETVTVYNAIGQKLISKLTVEGLNTITVSAHGMVIVKLGNRVSKVIL